jgi:ribosome-binding protein aMBF1 (putative translation factor)
MGEQTADDIARELLLSAASDRGAHDAAVQELVARNASLRTNDELIAEQLRSDPAFRAEWERTAPARAVAIALVRYRSDHNLSPRELADRLHVTLTDVARMELGEIEPSSDSGARISSALGIEFGP